MNACSTELVLQNFSTEFVLLNSYAETEAAVGNGSGAKAGAGLTSAGTATVSAFFTNRCGRPPGNLMRAGTPMTIMLLRTSVSTRLLAAITTLLPILQ